MQPQYGVPTQYVSDRMCKKEADTADPESDTAFIGLY